MILRILAAGAAGLLLAAGASAGEISPGDVTISEDYAVEASLTGVAGDPAAGRKWFADRKLGNCLACHQNADLAGQPFHGEVGPPVDGAAERWSESELRAIVVNSKRVFGDQTIMPGFYTLDLGDRVADDFAGKTILTAQQVEDIVAYLLTLKEGG